MTREERPVRPWWRRFFGGFWGQLLLAFLAGSLIVSFVVKPYSVPSGSMEHTLEPGDRALVDRVAYRMSAPAAGDVVVFEAGPSWGTTPTYETSPLRAAWNWFGQWTGFGPSGPHTLVKRVIAVGGQAASCCSTDGRVVVDQEPIDEPYVSNDFEFSPGILDCSTTPRSSRCFDPVSVPVDSYLVLGDNRSLSSDSAWQCRTPTPEPSCWRWAKRSDIVGRTRAIFWPVSRLGLIGP